MTQRSVAGQFADVEYQVSWRAAKHNLNEYQVDSRITSIIEHVLNQYSVDNIESEVMRFNRWPIEESFVLTRELEELFQHGLTVHELSAGRVNVFSPTSVELEALFELTKHVAIKFDDQLEVNFTPLLEGYIADRISELFRLLRVTDYKIEVNGATRLRVSGRQQQRHQYPVKLLDQAILVSMPYNQDKAFAVTSYGTQNTAVAQQVIVFHESATVAYAISATLAEAGQTKINDFIERNAVAALVILNENGEEKRYTSALFRRFLS